MAQSTTVERMELSEIAFGERLGARLLRSYRVVEGERDEWRRYDKGVFKKVSYSMIQREAANVVAEAYAPLKEARNKGREMSEYDRSLYDYIRSRCRKVSYLRAMISHAKTVDGLIRDAGDFDRGGGILAVENGTIELTGESPVFREHRLSDFLTKRAPVHYDPNATCPNFIHHVEMAAVSPDGISPDPDLASWIQRLLGYITGGHISEEVFVIFHGRGGNGKTTLLSAVDHVLGPYALTTKAESLVMANVSNQDAYFASLQGARLVWAGELPHGKRVSPSAVKSLTDRKIAARRLHCMPYEYESTHTICFAGQDLPVVTDDSAGMWDRLRVVPFHARIRRTSRQIEDFDKVCLFPEASGILNWLLEGYREWRAHKLGTCAAVDTASADYRAEQRYGTFQDFVEDHLVAETGSVVHCGDLNEQFEAWCRAGRFFYPPNGGGRRIPRELRALGWVVEKRRIGGRGGRKGTYVMDARLKEAEMVDFDPSKITG